MSRTFSTKNGSFDSLKDRWRCGCTPKACQMRCTVDFASRLWAAIWRTLQCVPSRGFVCKVLRIRLAIRSSLIERGRPGRHSSCNPLIPWTRKRRRHLPTVASVHRKRPAIERFVKPCALSRMIRTRVTNPCGRERELARLSNCARCSGVNTRSGLGLPSFMDTSIVHQRCPFSLQYYCHLFMGHDTRESRSHAESGPESPRGSFCHTEPNGDDRGPSPRC